MLAPLSLVKCVRARRFAPCAEVLGFELASALLIAIANFNWLGLGAACSWRELSHALYTQSLYSGLATILIYINQLETHLIYKKRAVTRCTLWPRGA